MTEVDEYIAGFPKEIQIILEKVRATVRRVAPEAEETMSYGMPAFRQKRMLCYYAAFKHHIGFFPPVSESLRSEATQYAGPKWNLQFPLDKPIPYDLITKIVKHRVKENLEREK